MADRVAPLAFHAAPPAGEWINDPNALFYRNGLYTLLAQHRTDAPAFRATGWARFTSPDLLDWTFHGPAIAPAGQDWIYSGCVLPVDGELVALHTLHAAGLERQVLRSSRDDGASWSAAEPLPRLGTAMPNRRDPFVFRDGGEWVMLLAEPCDWRGWADAAPSRLGVYRSGDLTAWRQVGLIGPWHPPGVMWEVPVLARLDGRDVLFVSTVDRRGEGADCAVRAWIGTFDGSGFTPDPRTDRGGQPVDLGPDFYALMIAAPEGWPDHERVCVSWLSSWATARLPRWPGFHGGPISLPRALSVEDGPLGPRLAVRVASAVARRFNRPSADGATAGQATAPVFGAAASFRLEVGMGGAALLVEARPEAGVLEVRRSGDGLGWHRAYPLAPAAHDGRTLRLYVDGPAIELFLEEEGLTVSAALSREADPPRVQLTVAGCATPMTWSLPDDGGGGSMPPRPGRHRP